jgi:hypothetical protein
LHKNRLSLQIVLLLAGFLSGEAGAVQTTSNLTRD